MTVVLVNDAATRKHVRVSVTDRVPDLKFRIIPTVYLIFFFFKDKIKTSHVLFQTLIWNLIGFFLSCYFLAKCNYSH